MTSAAVALVAWPQASPVLAEPGAAEFAEQLLKRPVAIEQASQRWLAAAQSGWDLAQFDLLSNRRTRTWRRLGDAWLAGLHSPRWRAARWAVLTYLLLRCWVSTPGPERQCQSAQQTDAVREPRPAAFPGVKTVVDAPLQMAREVPPCAGPAARSARDLESMLSALGSVTRPASRLPPSNSPATNSRVPAWR
jgi:general secretion pathway protein L